MMRVLFGDRELYRNKFKTCARCRPLGTQVLGADFYSKEHSKPLFNDNKILTLNNLYFYHTTNEVYKIFKFETPAALFKEFKFSGRDSKGLFTITPCPSDAYSYRASKIWNTARQITGIHDTDTKPSSLKENIKQYLLKKQMTGDFDNWTEHNFVLC